MPGCPRMPTRPPVCIAPCAPPWRRPRRSASSPCIRAHPDLAGKLAQAGRLTAESTHEQASAGLTSSPTRSGPRSPASTTPTRPSFGFPFIIAVKGLSKADILASFQRRISNDRDTELATALAQVERIALLRLKDMLP